jgi:hypothetical protein
MFRLNMFVGCSNIKNILFSNFLIKISRVFIFSVGLAAICDEDAPEFHALRAEFDMKLEEAMGLLDSAEGTGAVLLSQQIDSAAEDFTKIIKSYNASLSLKQGENFEDLFLKVLLGPPPTHFHENLVVAKEIIERLKSVINHYKTTTGKLCGFSKRKFISFSCLSTSSITCRYRSNPKKLFTKSCLQKLRSDAGEHFLN